MAQEKSRVYRLTNGRTPISYALANKDSRSKSLLYYDKDGRNGQGEQRALRYAPNQKSIFIDEQDGEFRLEPISFTDGTLIVQPRQVRLMEFLDHHPDNVKNGGGRFEIQDFAKEAQDELDWLDIEDEARKIAKTLSPKELRNIVRKMLPSSVDTMENEEIAVYVRRLSARDPEKLLSMVERSDVELEGTVADCLNANLIQFRKNDTEVYYNLKNKKKLLFRVPTNELPKKSLTDYLMSNEGMKVLVELEEELNRPVDA